MNIPVARLPLTEEDALIFMRCSQLFWRRLMTGSTRALVNLYHSQDRRDADAMLTKMCRSSHLKPRINYIRYMDLHPDDAAMQGDTYGVLNSVLIDP